MHSSDNIFGQERAIRFLERALDSGQVAHAYLFSGKDGVGRRALARAFAQALVCEKRRTSIEASCDCQACHQVERNIHPDVKWVGLDEDERSIKINEIRDVQHWVTLKPLQAQKKVCVVYKAERFTEEAANAFLKTLEEPPAHTYIVLIAEHTRQLSHTIVSRVVEVKLQLLAYDEVCTLLRSHYGIGEGVEYLAHHSEGSIGKACADYEDNFLEFKNKVIHSFINEGPVRFFLDLVGMSAQESDRVLSVVSSFMHDILLSHNGVDATYYVNQDCLNDIDVCTQTITQASACDLITLCEEGREALKRNVNSKLLFSRLAARGERLFSKTGEKSGMR